MTLGGWLALIAAAGHYTTPILILATEGLVR